jgi:glycolate oxidase iron-sulfur subunit
LEKIGYDVEVSGKEKCCGIPMIISGDYNAIKKNAKANLKLMTEKHFDYIVFTCPTCVVAFKEKYPEIFKDDQASLDKLDLIKDKIIEITQLISREKKLRDLLKETGISVTYHDPCHLVNSLGVTKEPREVIKQIPGINYIEMKDAATCCGSGGFYHVYFPEISNKIGDKKLENIKNSKADVVLTACPACKLQISSKMKKAGLNGRVMHVVELLNSLLK